jgi:hypothetical protein
LSLALGGKGRVILGLALGEKGCVRWPLGQHVILSRLKRDRRVRALAVGVGGALQCLLKFYS